MSEAAYFEHHLARQAPAYFPDWPAGQVQVTCLGEQVRAASTLYRFEVKAAGRSCPVVVKIPSSRQNQEAALAQTYRSGMERPRLAPDIDGQVKFQLEYTAMSTIANHFLSLEDGRFGAVRIFEHLPDKQALIMEWATAPRLRELVAAATFPRRLLARPAELARAFRHTGAWLHAYHAVAPPHQAEPRHTSREDFLATIAAFTRFLGRRCGREAYFSAAATQVQSAATAMMPAALPLALAHGDFALRNILVGAADRITVIDTLARWQAPIYEDIAYFLIGLKGNRLQVFTQGLALDRRLLAGYEQAFLAGYFGKQPVPRPLIRLFEIQALLDKWSSLFVLIHSGRRGAARNIQLHLTTRYYLRLMNRLLAALMEAL